MAFLTESDSLDIIMIKSSPNKYFWGERVFEIPELKLLIDAVSAARFISQDKSDDLIKKLISLAGKSQRHELNRIVSLLLVHRNLLLIRHPLLKL